MTSIKKSGKAVNDREWAIVQLNRWFDERNVLEEDRIQSSITQDELDGIPSDEQELAKEKSDLQRELVIDVIRKGILVVTDDGALEYTLKTPFTKANDEEVKMFKLAKTVKTKTYNRNMVGVKASDKWAYQAASQYARIASRVGVSRIMLEEVEMDDMDTLMVICGLF